MAFRRLAIAAVILPVLWCSCAPEGGSSEGGSAYVGFDQAAGLILGPSGKGTVSGTATYTKDPLTWTLSPQALAAVQNPLDSDFQGGWTWGRSWKAEVVAGAALGAGTLTLQAATNQGPRSGSMGISIVSWIQVLAHPQVNLASPGVDFFPTMGVGASPIGTPGVPQGLIWELVEPLPGGSLTLLDGSTGPFYARVKAPTVLGVYHLKATALADPAASGVYEFKVQ